MTSDLKLLKQKIREDEDQEEQLQLPKTKDVQDIYENITEAKDPFKKFYNLPRLFVVKNDGSGYELLTKEQLDYYFRVQKNVRTITFNNLQSKESFK